MDQAGPDHLSTFHAVVLWTAIIPRGYITLFPLDLVTTLRFCSDPESIVTFELAKIEFKPYPEVVRMATRPPTHLLDAPSVAQSVIDGEPK